VARQHGPTIPVANESSLSKKAYGELKELFPGMNFKRTPTETTGHPFARALNAAIHYDVFSRVGPLAKDLGYQLVDIGSNRFHVRGPSAHYGLQIWGLSPEDNIPGDKEHHGNYVRLGGHVDNPRGQVANFCSCLLHQCTHVSLEKKLYTAIFSAWYLTHGDLIEALAAGDALFAVVHDFHGPMGTSLHGEMKYTVDYSKAPASVLCDVKDNAQPYFHPIPSWMTTNGFATGLSGCQAYIHANLIRNYGPHARLLRFTFSAVPPNPSIAPALRVPGADSYSAIFPNSADVPVVAMHADLRVPNAWALANGIAFPSRSSVLVPISAAIYSDLMIYMVGRERSGAEGRAARGAITQMGRTAYKTLNWPAHLRAQSLDMTTRLAFADNLASEVANLGAIADLRPTIDAHSRAQERAYTTTRTVIDGLVATADAGLSRAREYLPTAIPESVVEHATGFSAAVKDYWRDHFAPVFGLSLFSALAPHFMLYWYVALMHRFYNVRALWDDYGHRLPRPTLVHCHVAAALACAWLCYGNTGLVIVSCVYWYAAISGRSQLVIFGAGVAEECLKRSFGWTGVHPFAVGLAFGLWESWLIHTRLLRDAEMRAMRPFGADGPRVAPPLEPAPRVTWIFARAASHAFLSVLPFDLAVVIHEGWNLAINFRTAPFGPLSMFFRASPAIAANRVPRLNLPALNALAAAAIAETRALQTMLQFNVDPRPVSFGDDICLRTEFRTDMAPEAVAFAQIGDSILKLTSTFALVLRCSTNAQLSSARDTVISAGALSAAHGRLAERLRAMDHVFPYRVPAAPLTWQRWVSFASTGALPPPTPRESGEYLEALIGLAVLQGTPSYRVFYALEFELPPPAAVTLLGSRNMPSLALYRPVVPYPHSPIVPLLALPGPIYPDDGSETQTPASEDASVRVKLQW
jgi:hypothetical protein